MSAPPPTEVAVREALARLSSALSYDPKETWLPAYQTLAQARAFINRSMRPAAIVQFIAWLLVAAASFVSNIAHGPTWLWMTFAIPGLIGSFASVIVGRFVPLVRYRGDIENASRPFHYVAQN